MENRNKGYGYDITHLIRENLMWKLNLPINQAQEIASNISDHLQYANWLEVQGSEYHVQFNKGWFKHHPIRHRIKRRVTK
jgi:hypothetical protein